MNLKSTCFMFLIIFGLLLTVGIVSASDNQTEMIADNNDFLELNQTISQGTGDINLTRDYKYDYGEILIEKESKFIINGNNHTIEGVSNCKAFEIDCKDLVIFNNLTFKNCNNFSFLFSSKAVLNDVKFINCSGNEDDNLFYVNSNLTINKCYFQLADGDYDLIYSEMPLSINNSVFTGGNITRSIIYSRGALLIENTAFENITSNRATAINYKGNNLVIKRSKFLNLHARLSGGAIIGKYFPLDETSIARVAVNSFIIGDCEFKNVTSTNNGGAIYFDLDSGSEYIYKNLNITGSNFTDCSSRFGGALAVQGGYLNIVNSSFINDSASFEGGALFTSWSKVNIDSSNFIKNTAWKNAGAIYFDKGKLTIKDSKLLDNTAYKQSDSVANCIYAHDVEAYFANSTFDNGGISVYADFASNSKLENITKNEDIFLLDNKNYIVSVENNGIKLNLTKNEIIIDKLPSKFDLCDWGWVTPAKYQGDNDDCWAFATVASIESSLLKATGQIYDLSPNYVQKLQLKYAREGDLRISFTGYAYSGLGYALSWYGALPVDSAYDERGMIIDTDFSDARIHLQDAMIIFGGRNDTIDLIKKAIIKYGAVSVHLYGNGPVEGLNTTGEDLAIMEHGIHFVSLIGWDDNFPDQSGNGAWLCKDSIGGFNYRSYYSSDFLAPDYYAIVPQNPAICYIFENAIDYHVNYQTDLTALTGFDASYTYYSNEFTSKYDEMIGAVGTYFNESGIYYSFDVYVNGVKVHTQTGVSEFAGFRTIVLNNYVPVRTGDKFKVVFKNNALPYQAYSRQHYLEGMTFVSSDGDSWKDITLENKTVCLKVYTVAGNATKGNNTFEDLHEDIMNSGDTFNMEHDYKYDENDDSDMAMYGIEDLTINGNGYSIDGANAGLGFQFTYGGLQEGGTMRLVINNLTFINFNYMPLDISCGNVTLNNVNFINCSCNVAAIIHSATYSELTLNNVVFDNIGETFSIILAEYTNITINNMYLNGANCSSSGIEMNRGQLIIENSTFENFSAPRGSIINFKGSSFSLKNSRFLNSMANFTGGAILAKFFPPTNREFTEYLPFKDCLIENCEFYNLTVGSDAGAIYVDLDSGADHFKQNLNIINSSFIDCSARYGGAIAIQGGNLNIYDSNFTNNYASFEGGAIFSSWTNLYLSGTVIFNNTAERNAGALYFDKGKLTINRSDILNNKIIKQSVNVAGAVYAHDVDAYFVDSTFDNGGISVYADFAANSKMENVTKNDDVFLMDNKNYIVSVESNGIKLNLTKNELVVDKLPSKFNLRDWGWVSPLKFQSSDNDDCWAFATVASLESALLKATGQYYNLSANYVQKIPLKYSREGDLRISLTGFVYTGLGYALSWFGALPMDSGYDDRGMLIDTDLTDQRIHLQDAVIILGGKEANRDLIKRAIMKYGSVTVQLILSNFTGELETTGEDIAVMDHGIHFVTLMGWDDNYIGDDEEANSGEETGNNDSEIIPGAWIVKESLTGFQHIFYEDEQILGIDYYAIVPQNPAIAYIFENDIDYHVNYQTDLVGLTGFDANYTYYSNEFTSKYDELIGAVGTYFNESGIDYSFDIYVNGVKVHSQSGVSEFGGFRTIILNKYIPVKAGDKFKVVFKNNNLPYQAYSRQHYLEGMTFVSADGNLWKDITLENKTVCLKVYTVADDCKIIENKDVTVNYGEGSYFTVKVITGDGRAVGAGEAVAFTINGKTSVVATDSDGIAKLLISEGPGTYIIKSSLNGKVYENTVTVKQTVQPKTPDKIVLKAKKVTIKKKSAKKLVLKTTLKINGKAVKGKIVKFKFRGKTYKAKTNKNGVAKKTLKKKVIKKLKKGKKYSVKVTYLKKTVKTTVKVR